MTLLVVIGAILLLLLLLLLVPIRLRLQARTGAELRLHLHILFLRFNLSPDRILERATRRAEKDKAPEPTPKAKSKGTEAAEDTVVSVVGLLKASRNSVGLIRRNLVVYGVRARVSVAREDAHQTAVAYGLASSLAAVLLSVVGELFVLLPPRVHVFPDFTKTKTEWSLSAGVRIQPIVLLGAALSLALTYIKLTQQNKKFRTKRKNKTKRKGGRIHESAASH